MLKNLSSGSVYVAFRHCNNTVELDIFETNSEFVKERKDKNSGSVISADTRAL